MATESKFRGRVQIMIDAVVEGTVGPSGTEFTMIDQDIKNGMEIAFDPKIEMSDEAVVKLNKVVTDAVLRHSAKRSADVMVAEGLAPGVSILNEPIIGAPGPKGNKSNMH